MGAEDYQKLLQAVVQACVEHAGKFNYPSIEVAFHHLTQFADDFPKGIVVKKDGPVNVHRMKARKLLDWLRKHGHTELTVEHIAVAAKAFTTFEREIFNALA